MAGPQVMDPETRTTRPWVGVLGAMLALAVCAACGSVAVPPDVTVRGRVIMVSGNTGPWPDPKGQVVFIGSDGDRFPTVVQSSTGRFLLHVPPGAYRVGGRINTYYGHNLQCSTTTGHTIKVPLGHAMSAWVGCGLP